MAGLTHSDNPRRGRDVTFNILAPVLVQNHATLGATFVLSEQSELSLAACTRSGTRSSVLRPCLTDRETIHMAPNSPGLVYGLHQ